MLLRALLCIVCHNLVISDAALLLPSLSAVNAVAASPSALILNISSNSDNITALNGPHVPEPGPHVPGSSSNIMKIACNGQRFGKNPKVASCRQIFGYLRHDETLLGYAQRDRGGGAHQIPLPIRTYSSRWLTSPSNVSVNSYFYS